MSTKSMFICQKCGVVHKKWSGQCSDCKAWNTISEEKEEGGLISHSVVLGNSDFRIDGNQIKFESLSQEIKEFPRQQVGIGELDRVLGGGLVKGSAVLIGGDPGIGKSTLLLQTICSLADSGISTTYISGEESPNQVRLRARRLGLDKSNVKLATATSVSDILKSIEKDNSEVVVIDSIQTVFDSSIASAPGTVSQVRICANSLITLAKNKDITILLVSHVNKDGQIAGPKVLEHMVDTVLYFEGDRDNQFRILRSIKNRFGAANEIGVFEMKDAGLKEIKNPSQLFLDMKGEQSSGSVVFGGIEGTRPLLIEIQALISPSYMASPRRAIVGWDSNRLAMIVAVLSTRMGLNLCDKEIYLNVVGGLKINEPGADLAVAMSLISAFKDKPIPKDCMFVGEIGLSGGIRRVSQIEARIKEAEKLGFKKAIIPEVAKDMKSFKMNNLEICMVKHVRDLLQFI